MLKNIEIMKQQDLRQAEIKQIRNQKMMSEVEVSNKIAQELKQQKVLQEKAHEMEIVRYNQEKLAKENARLEEEKRIREEKEFEI